MFRSIIYEFAGEWIINKADKEKLMDEYKMLKEKEFESSLPMERKLFYELFDFLNDKSETTECKHDFSLTKEA